MKNPRQIFKVFLTSFFVVVFFVGCNSTGNIDGVYEEYRCNDDSTCNYVEDIEFNRGKFKSSRESQWSEKLKYKIIDENTIEKMEENKYGWNSVLELRVIRDNNNKIIQMDGRPKARYFYKKKE
jgi:hypothetical protein